MSDSSLSQVKITIIYDNRCENHHLQEGWGFSAVIEYDDQKILFDTGGYPVAFFSNLEKLKIDVREITHAVLSHRHWDHIAALKQLLGKLNENTKIFIPKLFLSTLFIRSEKFKTVRSFEEIDKNVYSLVLKGGFLLYEQSLILNTSKGAVIITGCAHPGIVHIVKTSQDKLKGKTHLVIGGFHLLFNSPNISLEAVKDFQALGVEKVAPCHCSGDHTIRQFQEAYDNNFIQIGTGSQIFIN